jgi:hypothetical protein
VLTRSVRTFTPVSTDDRTTEPPNRQPAADHAPVQHYEIRIDGHLGARWAAWFDGMTLTREADGTTVICGPVVDQAALHGLLQKLRDLGVSLRSLTLLEPGTSTGPFSTPHDHTRQTPSGATS